MIAHITTVHRRTDTRIRVKEVASLARQWPGQVSLFVQDGDGDEAVSEGQFTIRDTGAPKPGRLWRMTKGAYRMYRAVRKARPKVVHFHDPELLPWALLLRLQGHIVVYDMHEDLPRQLRHKPYLSKPLAYALGGLVEVLETAAARILTRLIVVVPAMQERFQNTDTMLLANFPSIEEFPALPEAPPEPVPGRFAYVGAISVARCIAEMVDALEMVEDERAHLRLMGVFNDPGLEDETAERGGWRRVDFLGWSTRDTVVDELSKASAGLVLLHPTPQYVISYPVKMFEYMAAGLPVIASDFPVWREIVESADCGLLVDPLDPKAIAEAMQWVIDNPEEAQAMGRRGRVAVEQRYNWETESKKLISLYQPFMAEARA